MAARKVEGRKVRYGIVGAGWISQAALMPGVAHTGNSEMTAIVTGDEAKAKGLGQRYGITKTYHYDAYAEMIADGEVDAIYLALPNDQHRQFAVPALEAGLHVLLEKPMATSEEDCRAITAAADASGAKLMIAYRLHFEPSTLDALRRVRSGELGDVRLFTSCFTQHVAAANHRAHHGYWAGPVSDMGPYPINAARMMFGDEPIRVMAAGTKNPALAFDFDDTVAVTLLFPGERMAQFTVGYGLNSADAYRVVGTKGDIEMSPGFMFPGPIQQHATIAKATSTRKLGPVDQFGGELKYFSDCILSGADPEPDGEEGLMDVRVICAIERALATGQAQTLGPARRRRRVEPSQAVELPTIAVPPMINAYQPSEG